MGFDSSVSSIYACEQSSNDSVGIFFKGGMVSFILLFFSQKSSIKMTFKLNETFCLPFPATFFWLQKAAVKSDN